MSPSLKKRMESFVEQLNMHRIKRAEHREKEVNLLPADLTGQVFMACRREAEKIRARIAWLDQEIEKTKADIGEVEKQVQEACRQIYFPGKRKGDVLGNFQIEEPKPQPGAWQMTEEALKLKREQLQPLQAKLKALEAEKNARLQELGELCRIAEKAGAGEVGLIHFLSDKWRGRLEIGAAVEGLQAKLGGRIVSFVDAAGYPLPDEALDAQGKPDLPAAGRVPSDGGSA